MTAPAIIGTSLGTTIPATASLTVTGPLGMSGFSGGATGLTTEMFRADKAGTLSNRYARVSANGRSTDATITTYKNGVATSQAVTIPAGTTGTFQDTTNSVAVSVGDTLGYQYAQGSGSGQITLQGVATNFAAASGTSQFLSGLLNAVGSTAAASTTIYMGLVGTPAFTGTEADVKATLAAAGTLHGLNCYVVTNSRNAAVTLRSRINGANGNQTATIPAGTTGLFADTTNSDTVAAGDQANCSLTVASGTGTFAYWAAGCTFDASVDGQSNLLALQRTVGITTGTKYLPPLGICTFSSTENTVRMPLGLGGTVDRIGVVVVTNLSTADAALKLRKNAADGNGTITIPASTTGTFQDTTNADSVAATDLIALSISGQNNTITINQTLARFTYAVGGRGSPTALLLGV